MSLSLSLLLPIARHTLVAPRLGTMHALAI